MATARERRRRTTTSSHTAGEAWLKYVLRAFWHWDLVASVVLAAVAFAVMASTSAALTDVNVFAIPAIPFGIAVAGFNWTAQRSVVDRTKESPLGRLVRLVDPTEMRLTVPYLIGIGLGVITTLMGIAGLLFKYSLGRIGQAGFLAALLFFVLYSLFATVSLIAITLRHQRRYSIVQAEKEELERLQRELAISRKQK